MRLVAQDRHQCSIVHELPRRIRVRSAAFHDPAFDAVYLEALLSNIPGVERVRFNLKAATVVVAYDGEKSVRERIVNCIELIPLEAYHPSAERGSVPDPVGVAARGVVALLTPALPRKLRALVSWSLSLPVLLKGTEAVLSRGITVDLLDASAVGFSLWRGDYFTANSIVALLALGEHLEQLSRDKAAGLLRTLLRPRVETAWVEREGREVSIAFNELMIGDTVICGPGEMISVDGVVIDGEASVNQSSISGESVPVHVYPGSEVHSGSVIEEGRVKIDARRVGAETGMARISRFLESSLRFKSKSQQQADELADRLVPTIFGLGLGLFLLTGDPRRAAAVLTVDYSCAIRLANPVAMQTAMYTAAHCGVLLKGAQALDSLARVDTVVFDKTGTLTRGVLEVTDILPVGDMTPEELLTLAAGAEEHYAHPVARAVLKEARRRGLGLPPTGQVDFIVAHGVSAYVDGSRVLVGSRHFIGEDEGIDCSAADLLALDLRRQGKSLLYVARENVLQGLIALRDALWPEAARVLRELKAEGVRKIVALTGDHPDTARAVAGQLEGLDEIHWDLKPEDKASIVKKLQEQGHSIAFAGDGVNDAPALVTAELGICMPGGSELARESAQVILLRDDLSELVTARRIARKMQQTIENCFRCSVGLNSLFLLLACGGAIAPATAALLHNANTVAVLGYAAASGLSRPEGRGKEP